MSFREKKKVRSLQKRITLIYVAVITVFLSALGGLTYCTFRRVLTEQVVTDHEHMLKQSEENIDLMVNSINYAFVYMSADQYTAEILNHSDLDTVSAYNYIRLLKQQFTNFVDLPATDLDTVYRAYLFLNPREPLSPWLPAYGSGGESTYSGVYNTEAVKNQTWYRHAEQTGGKLIFSVHKNSGGQNLLYISKLISNPYIYSDSLGVALVTVSPDAFARQLRMSRYSEPTRILLTDDRNTVIYSNAGEDADLPGDSDVIGAVRSNGIESGCKPVKIGGELYMVSANQLQWGWYMISAVPYSSLTSGLKPILYLILLIPALFIVLGVLLSALAAKKITRPITLLAKAMERFDPEKEPCRKPARLPNDEIGKLYASFAAMVARIRGLISDIQKSHEKQLEAEYEMLSAQINPHFLYNTLNSINWMILMRGEYEISEAVSALSGVMQYSIGKKSSSASVKEELAHVEKFLVIEKLHYGDKIEYVQTVAQDCMNCVVPKIILQPLVENAIVHGVAGREGKGRVEILGAVRGEVLTLQVSDNGAGTDPERINTSLAEGSLVPAKEHGIGVLNVHNRIRMMYGEPYGLHYERNASGGITVTATCAAVKGIAVKDGEKPEAGTLNL